VAAASLLCAGDFTRAEISNGLIHATIYLPDQERGYYRGSRFDWSGVIASLRYGGHTYFGRWSEERDDNAITGPVDEFASEDGALGYAGARPGELFMKIGVGLLRKPDSAPYDATRPYRMIDPGRRIIRPFTDRIEFVHELSDGEGDSYVYRKTIRLVGRKPLLVIDYTLRNIGRKAIETGVCNHTFFVLDGRATGPATTIRFAFTPHAVDDPGGRAAVRGNEFVYLKELDKSESVVTGITGFHEQAGDNDVGVENHQSGAGVEEIGDHPLSRIRLWSGRGTVCPETCIQLAVAPKHEARWRISYRFYEVGR